VDVLATAVEGIGLVLVVIALGLVDYRLGIAAAGVILLGIGLLLEYGYLFRDEDEYGDPTQPGTFDAEGNP